MVSGEIKARMDYEPNEERSSGRAPIPTLDR